MLSVLYPLIWVKKEKNMKSEIPYQDLIFRQSGSFRVIPLMVADHITPAELQSITARSIWSNAGSQFELGRVHR